MEGKRLVNLSSLHGGHVVHLVLTELVRNLLRGRARRQLAVCWPFLLASLALTREKEVLLVNKFFLSRKGNMPHPEELFPS